MKSQKKQIKSVFEFKKLRLNNLKLIYGGTNDGDIDPPKPTPNQGPFGFGGPR